MNAMRLRLIGLAGVVGIFALLVGVPLLLLAVGANPIPASTPTWEGVWTALSAPDDGTALLVGFTVAAWAAWAFLTVAVVLEVIAQARGVTAPHLPGLSVPQGAARVLVSAALLLFTAAPMAAQAAPAPAYTGRPVAASSTATTLAAPIATTATRAPPATAATPKAAPTPGRIPTITHTVRHGETLWSIAERILGDGSRYPEIAKLNYGIPQPDGGRLTTSHWIHPGWALRVPAPANGSQSHASNRNAEPRDGQYSVRAGDNLWDVATAELGAGDRYPEIIHASRGVTQPDGHHLTDPDHLEVGWRLRIPHTRPQRNQSPRSNDSPDTNSRAFAPPTASPPSAAPTPSRHIPRPASPGSVTSPPTSSTAPTTPTAPTSTAAAPTTPPPAATTHSPTSTTSDPGVAHATATRYDDGLDWPAYTATGVGAVVAAGVLKLLSSRRSAQQRRRRPGQVLPMPSPATARTEQQLRTVADPLSVAAVDTALRSLARACSDANTPLPTVRAARLTADQFDLYLAEPADLPAPWAGTTDATVWALPADHATDIEPGTFADVPAPYPSLVTIGHDHENGHVLLDLEHLGALTLLGNPDRTREVMAAIAIELATSEWADDLQVVTVGMYPELEDALRTGRIRYLPTAAAVLQELTNRAAQDRAALADEDAPDLQHARVTGAAPDAWAPQIVLLAETLTASQRGQLQTILDGVPRVAVATVTTGAPVGEWTLTVPDDPDHELAVLSPIGLQVHPQRFTAETYAHTLDAMSLTDTDATAQAAADGPAEPTLADLSDIHPDSAAGAAEKVQDLSTPQRQPSPKAPVGVATDQKALTEPTDQARTPATASTVAARPTTSPAPTGPPDHGAAAPEAVDERAVDHQQPTKQDEPLPAPARPPSSDPTSTPSDHQRAVEAEVPGTPPFIRVLGRVTLDNANGPIEPGKRNVLLAYATYLALNPGASHTAIDEAVWPDRPAEDNFNTRNPATNKLRRWLGQTPDGRDYLPRHQGGGYALLPEVRTDWDDWNDLLADDPLHASTEHLERALSLVQGVPFTVASRRDERRYAWAEPITQRIMSQVVDASYELARRRLMEGRWRAAEQAAVTGLALEPGMERLWRLRILAAHEAHNTAAEQDAIDKLLDMTDRLGSDLEPETEALLAALNDPQTDRDHLMAAAL